MRQTPSSVTLEAGTTCLEAIAAVARDHCSRRFGQEPEWLVAAPGRVNLIGEHVDYNDGFVLPMAIERHVVLAACPSASPAARFYSAAKNETTTVPLDPGIRPGDPAWANYLRGIIAGFTARQPLSTGLEAVIHGNLPLGGGLSSSAALEVATCLLLEAVTGRNLEAGERIRLCQRAEHEFAGVPCGIMDQYVVASAQSDYLTLLDCQSVTARLVKFDDPAVTVLVTHSGVAHELGKGEYARRRADCFAAAEALGVKSLREARLDALNVPNARLRAVERKRARHVITEIERTLEFAKAIEARDWIGAGQLMYASHVSLRDDYEVSCAELDALVEIAQGLGAEHGVFGARLTGGGFGGCTVSLVRTDAVKTIQQRLAEAYQNRTGIAPQMFASRPAQGAQRLP